MPKNILFCFAGTGDTAKKMQEQYEGTAFNNNVVRIYFNGCQDKAIGGSSFFGFFSPNLDVVAKHIRQSFDSKGQLSLSQLKEIFGKSIIIEPADIAEDSVEVEDITLAGFSRGAVTTFAVARHLNNVGKPIRLFAQEPVPGDTKDQAKAISSEFFKNHDLSGCNQLVEAQVVLGAYHNDVNPLHNKFCRQMAPLFAKTCASAIYSVPTIDHFQFSRKVGNQLIDFFARAGMSTDAALFYDEAKDQMVFTPKIAQQKHHIGALGRIQLLPRYKKALFNLVAPHQLSEETSIKIAQALYCLQLAPDFKNKDMLSTRIKEDASLSGKALREFIVEFEHSNQFVFREDIDEKSRSAMNQFRQAVYESVHHFSIDKANVVNKQVFVNTLMNELKELKSHLTSKHWSALNELMTVFLKENILCHPHLAQYIDETETFNRGPLNLKTSQQAMLTIDKATNGDEIAEMLYHMSDGAREYAFDNFPKQWQKMITNAKQLGDILLFLPLKHMIEVLRNDDMRRLVSNKEHLDIMMDKMFYPAQRRAIFNALQGDINTSTDNLQSQRTMRQQLSGLREETIAAGQEVEYVVRKI